MNILKKIYCRAFQFAFKTAIPILPYRDPKEMASVDEVPHLLKKLGRNTVLLVTDKPLREAKVTARLEEQLKKAGIKCVVFDAVEPNPTIKNVEEARKVYMRNNCKALIGFGGGSSIDCAKAVGARLAYPKRSIDQMKGILRIWRRIPPFIAIPTTAGTGSEITVASIITDSDKKHKYALNSFPLIPGYNVLDPRVTYTLPPQLTATTGMDALTHAVEAYIGGSTTKKTRALAREAVRLIFENIETAYKDGQNYEARNNMLHASNRAGLAFSISYVGYVHAVAHSLGGQYGIPHGLANAVLLPIVLEDYGECVYKKLSELAEAAGIADYGASEEENAKAFIKAVREFNKKMGIPETLKGIKQEDIPVMAGHADKEANPLYPVPKLMDAKELERFYYLVGDWSEDKE
ncbi:MAG: iron-containing alcohol dehydrogenase [Lachnospiraceae bacterium]|nr:iron-containing alcohol dehydrogenase [Lachnospiraceae bacterium]